MAVIYTNKDIKAVLSCFEKGMNRKKISKKTNVSYDYVCRIIRDNIGKFANPEYETYLPMVRQENR